MKRMITIAFMMTVVVMMAHAQGALKRVYNEAAMAVRRGILASALPINCSVFSKASGTL